MKKRLNAFKSYLYFNRFERKGILVLIIVLAILMWIRIDLVDRLKPIPEPVDFSEIQGFVDSFEEKETIASTSTETSANLPSQKFPFDPNKATSEELRRLGFSNKLAQTLINFRTKGGQFFKKEDLKRIYGLNLEFYLELEPYIKIQKTQKPRFASSSPEVIKGPVDPNKASFEVLLQLGFPEKVIKTLIAFRKKGAYFNKPEDLLKVYGLEEKDIEKVKAQLYFPAPQKREVSNTKRPVETPTFIDINKSTAEDWQKLRGIGPAFSNRIIKFRDKLGGFVQVEQIAETWGLPDSTFQQIKPFLTNSPVFKQISLNDADEKTLSAHPYIDKKMALLIVRYRKNHGPFSDKSELLKIPLIKQAKLAQISPYLSL